MIIQPADCDGGCSRCSQMFRSHPTHHLEPMISAFRQFLKRRLFCKILGHALEHSGRSAGCLDEYFCPECSRFFVMSKEHPDMVLPRDESAKTLFDDFEALLKARKRNPGVFRQDPNFPVKIGDTIYFESFDGRESRVKWSARYLGHDGGCAMMHCNDLVSGALFEFSLLPYDEISFTIDGAKIHRQIKSPH